MFSSLKYIKNKITKKQRFISYICGLKKYEKVGISLFLVFTFAIT